MPIKICEIFIFVEITLSEKELERSPLDLYEEKLLPLFLFLHIYVCIFLSFLYFNKKITCHMEYKYIYFNITDFVTMQRKKILRIFQLIHIPLFPSHITRLGQSCWITLQFKCLCSSRIFHSLPVKRFCFLLSF